MPTNIYYLFLIILGIINASVTIITAIRSRKLQTYLDILKDKRQKNYSQSQQAIVVFFSDCLAWEHKAIFLSSQKPFFNDLNLLTEHYNLLVSLREKARLSGQLLTLLVDDDKCVKTCYELISVISSSESILEKWSRNASTINSTLNQLYALKGEPAYKDQSEDQKAVIKESISMHNSELWKCYQSMAKEWDHSMLVYTRLFNYLKSIARAHIHQ